MNLTSYLVVRCRRREGALLRILGTAERRGFEVTSLNVVSDADQFTVRMQVTSSRAPDLLARQLGRLVDVVGVQLALAPVAISDSPLPVAPDASSDAAIKRAV